MKKAVRNLSLIAAFLFHSCVHKGVDIRDFTEEKLQIRDVAQESGSTVYQRATFHDGEKFLIDLGFERFTEKAQQTLNSGKKIDPVSKAALKETLNYYKQLESAREISALTYSLLENTDCFKSEECPERDLVIRVIVQQTKYFPLIALEPLSSEAQAKYKTLKGDAALDFRTEYYEERGHERFTLEKTNIAKILKYMSLRQKAFKNPSEEAEFEKFVDTHLYEVLSPNYMANSRQQNRYLGRGLIAVYVKLAKDKNCTLCMNKLENELALSDVKIEQIIAANYRLKNDKTDQLIQLKNGDLALEYSQGGEAYLISMGLKPAAPVDKEIAKSNKLISGYGGMLPNVVNPAYKIIRDRLKKNYVISEDQERLLEDYWNPESSKGFSHVGIVQVKTDAATQISLAWIWDIYPQSDAVGVVRPMTPDGFAYPERFIRIGFARYNAEKLRQKFLAQKSEQGYLPVVWKSSSSFMGLKSTHEPAPEDAQDKVLPLVDKTKNYEWPSLISKEELNGLIEKAKSMNGEEWYQTEALPRVFNQIREYIYGPNALVFAKGLVNAKAMSYCSQLVTLSYLQSMNFDLQTHADKYRTLPKVAGTVMPSMLGQALDERIIAPGGLVWQSDAFESLVQLNFGRARGKSQQILTADNKSLAAKYVDLTAFPALDKIAVLKNSEKTFDQELIDDCDDEE
ncbi:MAG: hypothetical protein NDI63_12445 [Pseudobdellovibrio sp.]|nr:hypothetical protein [Pseudobdellovibrio sp.]